LICDSYIIEEGNLLGEVLSLSKPKPTILVQAPEGLKKLYKCLGDFLRGIRELELYFSLSPSYGACDIPVDEAFHIRPDLIIHLGHLEYKLSEVKIPWRVLYLPVYYNIEVPQKTLLEVAQTLKAKNWRTIAVINPVTEALIARRIRGYLLETGFRVLEPAPGEFILGCDYSPMLKIIDRVDGLLIVAGGIFHPLGAAFYTDKIVAYDPYRDVVWNPVEEASRVVRKRMFTLVQLRNQPLRRAVVIAGGRPGQFRASIIELTRRALSELGVEHYVVSAPYITVEKLISIDDAFKPDFIVVTSCPRLPIDDFIDFHKPVLTPGEVIMLARGVEKYVYPW
jgi:2-(3-amino-3-carboxypropyl)histidine synthase